VEGDRLPAEHGDILKEQRRDALALPRRGAGALPHGRKIGGEPEDLLPVGVVEGARSA
jgi:hypothetical protein